MLKRHEKGALLFPQPLHRWESLNVFNCAVTEYNGLFHMHYRAQGLDLISRIGYAVSRDGIDWNRLEDPVLVPHQGREDYRGVEDPRVTPLDGRFYMTYTAFGDHSYFPMIAVSDNLITWEDVGPLERAQNKDHVLFPEKIGGRYAILHRRKPVIWIAFSDDLIHWTDHTVVLSTREASETPGGWDSKSIGANGLPIKTPEGWLLTYHGYNQKHIYRHSVALLDLNDPTKVLHRPRTTIMEPVETWEIRGDVPNVVFSCSNNVVGDELRFYYGGADRMVGLATCKFEDFKAFAISGE